MNKQPLRFHDDRHFRILEVSDFHAGKQNDPKLTVGLEALLKETKPDFVVFGGDQCLDRLTKEEVRTYFTGMIRPVLDRQLPWGAIFGNHDHECGIPVEEEIEVYESIEGCRFTRGPEELHGITNCCVPVLFHDSDRPAYFLWSLDSNRYVTDYSRLFGLERELTLKDFVLPIHNNYGQNGATPLFDQVNWYYQGSKEAEKTEGHKVPGVMFMHIPLPEYAEVLRNPEETHARGSVREKSGFSEISSGLFLAALERGDIRGFFFAHEHLIDLEGEYCGITMACDAALGYNMSAHDDLRGGRVIDLYENGRMDTHMVHLIDLLGRDAMRNPDYFEGGCPYFIRVL